MFKSKLYLILIIPILYLFFWLINPYNKNAFDLEEWHSGDIGYRTSMVKSIIKSDVLIGKSKTEIIKLLGEQKQYYKPTAIPNSYSYPINSAWFNWVWFDDAYLLIEFTSDDTVKKVWVAGT